MLNLNKVMGAKPVKYEKLRGGTLVNLLEKEVETEEGTQWEYYQTFTTETDEIRLKIIYEQAVKQVLDSQKVDALSRLTVATTSGKVFYADTEARIDLQSAIDAASLLGTTETMWKLAEEFEGQRVVLVSLDEIREASALALQTKGQLVGAVE